MTLNHQSSRSSKVRGHGANRQPIDGFLHNLHCVQHCICHGIRDIWYAIFLRPMTVQGDSRSKVMLPIDSPWVISYSPSIDPIIVSVYEGASIVIIWKTGAVSMCKLGVMSQERLKIEVKLLLSGNKSYAALIGTTTDDPWPWMAVSRIARCLCGRWAFC